MLLHKGASYSTHTAAMSFVLSFASRSLWREYSISPLTRPRIHTASRTQTDTRDEIGVLGRRGECFAWKMSAFPGQSETTRDCQFLSPGSLPVSTNKYAVSLPFLAKTKASACWGLGVWLSCKYLPCMCETLGLIPSNTNNNKE